MIERKITIDIRLNPHELAYEFSIMSDSEQASFFNELYHITEKWKAPLCFQLQYLTDNEELTDGGRRVMEIIGEYARPSEVT